MGEGRRWEAGTHTHSPTRPTPSPLPSPPHQPSRPPPVTNKCRSQCVQTASNVTLFTEEKTSFKDKRKSRHKISDKLYFAIFFKRKNKSFDILILTFIELFRVCFMFCFFMHCTAYKYITGNICNNNRYNYFFDAKYNEAKSHPIYLMGPLISTPTTYEVYRTKKKLHDSLLNKLPRVLELFSEVLS